MLGRTYPVCPWRCVCALEVLAAVELAPSRPDVLPARRGSPPELYQPLGHQPPPSAQWACFVKATLVGVFSGKENGASKGEASQWRDQENAR